MTWSPCDLKRRAVLTRFARLWLMLGCPEDTNFEEELASDVLEIITVFAARLYGSRSHRNQKLIDGVRAAVKESQCT